MSRIIAPVMIFSRGRFLSAAAFLTLTCLVGVAQDHAPYIVEETGEKVPFQQIDKEHLGRLCSVFHNAGRPTAITAVGPDDPKGMVTQRGTVRIVTGELHAIGKKHIQIIAFYDQDRERGGTRLHHIQEDDIDHVVFKQNESGQQVAEPPPCVSVSEARR